jgi:uncharacterized damage-inducible protein DinB
MLVFRKKNAEILLLVDQLKELYEGDPWHGKGVKVLFDEVNPANVFEKPSGHHSILELVWHMANWKEFALSRLIRDAKDLKYFEETDWRILDHTDKGLWEHGLQRFWKVHHEFMKALQQQNDKTLNLIVQGRNYSYRKLLNGVREHDLFHAGQIAYINKLINNS